jgi:predicted alpha/beta superfamily hydrolase
MRKLFAAGFLSLLISSGAAAQHRVTFRIEEAPAYASSDSIYIAGSFNGWQPGATRFARAADGIPTVTVTIPAGPAEYKITRGSWARVESEPGGGDHANRSFVAKGDTTISLRVADWKDHFGPTVKKSTASSRVRILNPAFYMPQLDRSRRIWICLPAGYEKGSGRYPVLYMHDGQNLFDDSAAFSGEWGIDEAMDTMQQKTGAVIIVGIDHGGPKRLNEYSPYDMERYGKGEGAAYTDFLVQTLKPWIDSAFRTRKGPADTYIAGSSMGGLISMYAILRYPNVFGGAGVFSPAFWVAPNLKRDVLRWGADLRGRVFFYAGEQESKEMVPDMLRIFQLLRQLSRAPMQTVIRAEGRHTESAWRKEFPLFIEWIMKKPPVKPMPKF